MKFGKFILLGTILAATAPVAMADSINYLDSSFTVSGTGNFTGTKDTFTSNKQTGVSNPLRGASAVTISGSTDALITNGTTAYFVPNTPMAGSAFLTFSDPSDAVPVLLLQFTTSGGLTVKLYATDITNVSNGKNATTGAHPKPATFGEWDGEGYIVETGTGALNFNIPVTFELDNQTAGSGSAAYDFTVTGEAPEPSSLALLGTGMMGLAGVGYRKFRTNKVA